MMIQIRHKDQYLIHQSTYVILGLAHMSKPIPFQQRNCVLRSCWSWQNVHWHSE